MQPPIPWTEHRLDVRERVEDFAKAMAYGLHVASENEALVALGIPGELWRDAQAHWMGKIADEALLGAGPVGSAFATAMVDARRLLAATAPKKGSADAGSSESSDESALDATSEFLLKASNRAAVASPAPDAPAAPEPKADLPRMRVVATEELAFVAVARNPLPFDPNAESRLPAPTPPHAPDADRDPLDATLSVQIVLPAADLPFLSTRFPAMSLEHYASLCANLNVFPEKLPIILARYGLANDTELARLHQAWRTTLDGDQNVRDLWQRRFADIRARLKTEA
jgi:hypothetical protein